jgi:uncharacterized protein YgiM (DUF1202 family)
LSKSLENQNVGSSFTADRRYAESLQNLKKKEKQNRETIQTLQKKLKFQEKKSQEESRVSVELKKRHDYMYKKLEIVSKEKNDISK